MSKLSEMVADIVHTSVQDGLCSAGYASVADIKKAITYERRNGKRVALIAGLERELRRRAKGGKRSGESEE